MRLVRCRKIITVLYHLHVTSEKARFMKTDKVEWWLPESGVWGIWVNVA